MELSLGEIEVLAEQIDFVFFTVLLLLDVDANDPVEIPVQVFCDGDRTGGEKKNKEMRQ